MRDGTTALLVLASAGALLGLAVAFTWLRARRAERRVPPQGDFLNVPGARLHFVDRGAGPALVLIHGLGGSLGNFTHSLVARLESDFRVVAVDRPGAGYSTRTSGTLAGPFEDARAVLALVRSLGLERPILVGHSLGGAVALAAALQEPRSVAGLALIAPLTNRQEVPHLVFRGFTIASRLLRGLFAWTLASPATVVVRPLALRIIFGPDPVPADFNSAGGGDLVYRPKVFVEASRDALAVQESMPRLLERYPELNLPVGMIYGTDDRILDPTHHGRAMVERIPNLELELVEGGHMLPVSHPDPVAALVHRVAERVG